MGYRWVCKTCQNQNITTTYEGETARSVRLRANEHVTGFKNKNTNNILYKHKIMDHKTEEVEFKFESTGKFKDALTRQANESVRIRNQNVQNCITLNSKSQFNHPPMARVVVEGKKNCNQANSVIV